MIHSAEMLPVTVSHVGPKYPGLLEPVGTRLDALVGGGQRDPDVPGAGGAVERAGRDQDAAVGQPADSLPAVLVAGGPQVEAGGGVVDAEAGAGQRGAQHLAAAGVPLPLLRHVAG